MDLVTKIIGVFSIAVATWIGESAEAFCAVGSPIQIRQNASQSNGLDQRNYGASQSSLPSPQDLLAGWNGNQSAQRQPSSIPQPSRSQPPGSQASISRASRPVRQSHSDQSTPNQSQPYRPATNPPGGMVTRVAHRPMRQNPVQSNSASSGQSSIGIQVQAEGAGTTPSAMLPATKSDYLDNAIPGPGQAKRADKQTAKNETTGMQPLYQAAFGLMIVLPLAVIFLFLMKKATPKSMLGLPSECIEVLGNTPLDAKHHLKLIRLGNKLVLLSVSETNVQTVSEVHQPEEVQRLIALCQNKNQRQVAQTFQAVLNQGERDQTTGFLGSEQTRLAGAAAGAPARRGAAGSTHFFEA